MKKKTLVLGMAVLLAALLGLSGVAQSAMWVGAELGGNFIGRTSLDVDGVDFGSTNFNTGVIGGATIGYDFVNAGFGAYAWPDWMKYFSFATDITYNKVSFNSGAGGLADFFPNGARFNGYCVAWTFLFMAHYGFMPDSEVPSGRINPYIGVGPAVVWSGGDFSTAQAFVNNRVNTRRSVSATNIALVVEPGIRWVALKNVSIDTAFRWRYCEPSWGDDVTIKANPLNQYSFLVRANYHF